MPGRIDLQTIFENLLGSRNVYFQPPASIKMRYPAIVYGLDDIENTFANDEVYLSKRKYAVTVIDEDPDSPIVDKIAALPTCQFNRHFESDNLNHDVFILHY
ncbi:hypothetical protein FACS1894171_2460 [Clostridia bacterium]|nr:hypothetical protein FACS1894171_2460 [Clostridia bacterium]